MPGKRVLVADGGRVLAALVAMATTMGPAAMLTRPPIIGDVPVTPRPLHVRHQGQREKARRLRKREG